MSSLKQYYKLKLFDDLIILLNRLNYIII